MLPPEYKLYAGDRTTPAGKLSFDFVASDLVPVFPLHSPRVVPGAAALCIHESCRYSLFESGLIAAIRAGVPVWFFGQTPPALPSVKGFALSWRRRSCLALPFSIWSLVSLRSSLF